MLARFSDPASAEARATVQAVLREPEIADPLARGELALCLRLPSHWALCRAIDLPLAAEGNLSDVVGFELDRHTPFRAEQVYFCQRILARDPTAQRLAVEITVVPRWVIDSALRTAGELGWAPERIDVADPSPDTTHSGNLLVTTATALCRDGARATFGLAAAAAVLTLAAVAIPFVTVERRAAAMTEAVAAVEKPAQAAVALRKEIAAQWDSQDFLIGRKRQAPTVSRLLAEVTRLLRQYLPDRIPPVRLGSGIVRRRRIRIGAHRHFRTIGFLPGNHLPFSGNLGPVHGARTVQHRDRYCRGA